MEVVWTNTAKKQLKESLEYWDIKNGTPFFSDKIFLEVKNLTRELSDNPIYLGRYNKELNLYVRPLLKGRYFVYFQIKNNKGVEFIEIQYFKSSNEEPIS